jgi:hypothetical protein
MGCKRVLGWTVFIDAAPALHSYTPLITLPAPSFKIGAIIKRSMFIRGHEQENCMEFNNLLKHNISLTAFIQLGAVNIVADVLFESEVDSSSILPPACF